MDDPVSDQKQIGTGSLDDAAFVIEGNPFQTRAVLQFRPSQDLFKPVGMFETGQCRIDTQAGLAHPHLHTLLVNGWRVLW